MSVGTGNTRLRSPNVPKKEIMPNPAAPAGFEEPTHKMDVTCGSAIFFRPQLRGG
jgi:hypothetical protein